MSNWPDGRSTDCNVVSSIHVHGVFRSSGLSGMSFVIREYNKEDWSQNTAFWYSRYDFWLYRQLTLKLNILLAHWQVRRESSHRLLWCYMSREGQYVVNQIDAFRRSSSSTLFTSPLSIAIAHLCNRWLSVVSHRSSSTTLFTSPLSIALNKTNNYYVIC